MKTVVFDIGGVLIDWQPHLAWEGEYGTPAEVAAFMARVDFAARNARADAGETFADLAAELDDAEDARWLADYVALYPRTVMQRIEGTWALLNQLATRGHPIHAITNWSAETWPRGLTVQPRLAAAFGTTVISGVEGVKKPDPRIFALLCERAGVAPEDCVFIDDGPHNIAGAHGAGMDGILFTDPVELEMALVERGLL